MAQVLAQLSTLAQQNEELRRELQHQAQANADQKERTDERFGALLMQFSTPGRSPSPAIILTPDGTQPISQNDALEQLLREQLTNAHSVGGQLPSEQPSGALLPGEQPSVGTPGTSGGAQPSAVGLEGSSSPEQRQKLPTLSRFEGSRVAYRPWRLEAIRKLQIDGNAIGTPFARFQYIFTRLGTKVQQMVTTFVERGGPSGEHVPAEFITYLDSIYLDPNASARAADRLRTMRQGKNETFAAFLPRFERQLADSHLDENDRTQINYLRGALNDEMKRSLVTAGTFVIYGDLVRTLLSISSNLESLQFGRRAAPGRSANPDAMEWTPEPALAANRAHPAPAPARTELRTCFYCRQVGHIARDCPRKRVRLEQPNRSIRSTQAQLPTPEIEEDDADSESEKE